MLADLHTAFRALLLQPLELPLGQAPAVQRREQLLAQFPDRALHAPQELPARGRRPRLESFHDIRQQRGRRSLHLPLHFPLGREARAGRQLVDASRQRSNRLSVLIRYVYLS